MGLGSIFRRQLPFWCVVHHKKLLFGVVQFVAVHSDFEEIRDHHGHGAFEGYTCYWIVGGFVPFHVPVSLHGIRGNLQGLWRVCRLDPCESVLADVTVQIENIHGPYEP